MKLFKVSRKNDGLRKQIFTDFIEISEMYHKAAQAFFLNASEKDIQECEKILKTTEEFIPLLRGKIDRFKQG